MTDGKPRRTRRSTEQMFVELKQRLREISLLLDIRKPRIINNLASFILMG
jgi:hypothetical protein